LIICLTFIFVNTLIPSENCVVIINDIFLNQIVSMFFVLPTFLGTILLLDMSKNMHARILFNALLCWIAINIIFYNYGYRRTAISENKCYNQIINIEFYVLIIMFTFHSIVIECIIHRAKKVVSFKPVSRYDLSISSGSRDNNNNNNNNNSGTAADIESEFNGAQDNSTLLDLDDSDGNI
jgi:hypothetical protein